MFKEVKPGRVYWITGLSGAGKTTIGTGLYQELRQRKKNVIFLDGDQLRQVFQNRDYSLKGRELLAMQYSRLCHMLSEQGIDVICCTIAMFDSCREWNRKNIRDYFEVYLKVPIETLVERDQKGLYSGALKNEIHEVMGVNLEFAEPKHPDMVIKNDGEMLPETIIRLVMDNVLFRGGEIN